MDALALPLAASPKFQRQPVAVALSKRVLVSLKFTVKGRQPKRLSATKPGTGGWWMNTGWVAVVLSTQPWAFHT